MSEKFHRCGHCRGFYETTFEKCKWCGYRQPVLTRAGKPKVYPNRPSVRTLQLAEHDQLPPKVRSDPMGPPRDRPDLLCACLHCGPDGHFFEAIEMRWMANERMWACPCTTCGGRGFHFDIFPANQEWQCAECGHFYTPEKYTSKYALCPKCGCRMANGWFDDENEDGEPMTDEERDAEMKALEAELDAEVAAKGESEPPPPAVEKPWENDAPPFDSIRPNRQCEDEDDCGGEANRLDDIDFPRDSERGENDESAGGLGDIPF